MSLSWFKFSVSKQNTFLVVLFISPCCLIDVPISYSARYHISGSFWNTEQTGMVWGYCVIPTLICTLINWQLQMSFFNYSLDMLALQLQYKATGYSFKIMHILNSLQCFHKCLQPKDCKKTVPTETTLIIHYSYISCVCACSSYCLLQIAMIKVAAGRMACKVVDCAIQVHGGAGVSDDLPLAQM